MTARVVGIGGIFFKARDPDALRAWYRDHLGLPVTEWGGVTFEPALASPAGRPSTLVWSVFPADTKYFDPSPSPFMINYRVDDLDQVLAALRAEGCAVDERVDSSEFGRFGGVVDPRGTGWSCGSRLGKPDRETRARAEETAMKTRAGHRDELQSLPAIGPSLAADLRALGVRHVADLKRRDPERLYAQLNRLRGTRQDPCVLYAFRCAAYAARTGRPRPALLKWWNWKNRAL